MRNLWDNIYSAQNQLNRYPWDCIVSFLHRQLSGCGKSFSDASILELGCGGGSNLWFAAREGAKVRGVDFSESAIEFAKARFERDKLNGTFDLATLPDMPNFGSEQFDFVIDRACLTHCSHAVVSETLARLGKVINPDGAFFSSVYGTDHRSCVSGKRQADGLTVNIKEGSLQGVGGVSFYDEKQILEIFGANWRIKSLMKRHDEFFSGCNPTIHAEWHIVMTPS